MWNIFYGIFLYSPSGFGRKLEPNTQCVCMSVCVCVCIYIYIYMGECSQYSGHTMCWMVQSHFPGMGWTLFSLKHPVPLWGPPSLLYGVYWDSYPGVKVWGLNFTHSPPSRPTLTSPVYLYGVLSDHCYLYLYLQSFHDTHRVNGNRASFIHDTDIDLRESSTVSIN